MYFVFVLKSVALTQTYLNSSGVRSDSSSEPTTDGNIKIEKLEKAEENSSLDDKIKSDPHGGGLSLPTSQSSVTTSLTPNNTSTAPPPAKRSR